jgi:thiol-disulfide isomerase/thioredoxin
VHPPRVHHDLQAAAERPRHRRTRTDEAPCVASGKSAWLAMAVVASSFATVPALLRWTREKASGTDLVLSSPPRESSDLRFADGQGAATRLAAFRGRVLLLNVWATWCPPCREEMPTLDRLQALLGGPDFEVVALSIDQGGVAVVQAFLRRTAIRHLQPYVNAFGEASPSLGAGGIPLTLLIGRDGREIGRKRGPAAWDHPRIVEVIRAHLSPAAAPSRPGPGSRRDFAIPPVHRLANNVRRVLGQPAERIVTLPTPSRRRSIRRRYHL